MPECCDDSDCGRSCERGERGKRGKMGFQGPRGFQGFQGIQGFQGFQGTEGKVGPQGNEGKVGTQGLQGLPAVGLASADFYAMMPNDNAATVAVGADVSFPQDGSNIGGTITRGSGTTFQLGAIGVYLVLFQVSVNEPGQLELTLNGSAIATSVVGRATGTSQIVGHQLVPTTVINSILTVRNPAGNSTALTITPIAGGTHSVSAHLTIVQVA